MLSRQRTAVLSTLALGATLTGTTLAVAVPGSLLGGLARPHAKFVSGSAARNTYYAKSHTYIASFSTERSDGSGRFPANSVSEYEVPKSVYPHGYEVSVKGAYVVSGTDDEELLIASARNAKTVHLTIKPASALR